MKTCECNSSIPNDQGICEECGLAIPWSKLNPSDSREAKPAQPNPKPLLNRVFDEISGVNLSTEQKLKDATNKVIRFSSIFDRLSSLLNVFNYIVAVVLASASFLLGTSGENGGLTLLLGLLTTLVVWVIGWIQVALLRGLSAFFLMKGLAQQMALEQHSKKS